MSLALAQYPSISKIRIAFGDAGVIPYYLGSLSLDTVGLTIDLSPRSATFASSQIIFSIRSRI